MFTIFVRTVLGLLLTISVFACQSNNPNTPKDKVKASESVISSHNDSLYRQVMYIHDEVMPLNNHILALQQKLKKHVGKLSDSDNAALLDILAQLQRAYDGMMGWMANFKNLELEADTYQNWSESEIEKYLQAEESKIKEVAQMMRQSLAAANEFAKKIE